MNKHLKLSLKLFFGSIGAIVTGCLVCAQINICTFTLSNHNNHSRFFREIYEQNNEFGEVPLTKVAMLASHDSLSNEIGVGSKPNTNEIHNPVNNIFFRGLGKGAIVRFSRAQDVNVYEQLNAGCRMIDLRITHLGDTYYNSHGLLSNTLEHNLKLILKWLEENPGEFIIFNLVYFYDKPKDETPKEKDWKALQNFISNIRNDSGKNILDYDYNDGIGDGETKLEFKKLNYNNITKNGTVPGAVLMTSNEYVNEADGGSMFSNHSNKVKGKNALAIVSDKAIRSMREFANTIKNMGDDAYNYLIINETQTQPGGGDRIFGSLLCWSLLAKAHEHNLHVLEQTDIEDIMKTLPIYMCDYSTSNDTGFNDSVIKKLTNIDINLKK